MTVITPTQHGSNPGARICPEFISGFPVMRFQWEERRCPHQLQGAYGDFVKFQYDMSAQSLGGTHKRKVCVCAFIWGECMCVYMSACVCTVFQKKERTTLHEVSSAG